jgi:hypothetical protein
VPPSQSHSPTKTESALARASESAAGDLPPETDPEAEPWKTNSQTDVRIYSDRSNTPSTVSPRSGDTLAGRDTEDDDLGESVPVQDDTGGNLGGMIGGIAGAGGLTVLVGVIAGVKKLLSYVKGDEAGDGGGTKVEMDAKVGCCNNCCATVPGPTP